MALNATELRILNHLVSLVRGSQSFPVPVLSLGYPDILAIPSSIQEMQLDLDFESIDVIEDSKTKWINHGRDLDSSMFESVSLFKQLGADLKILDFTKDKMVDYVTNLNENYVPSECEKQFDIIVDPGTLEHCFNIANAMSNCIRMLRVGGYIIHQYAMAFINHGFYSISPTFFADFYLANGYEISTPYRINRGVDQHGFVVQLKRHDCFEVIENTAQRMIGLFIAKKITEEQTIVYPIQNMYTNRARKDVVSFDLIKESLPFAYIVE